MEERINNRQPGCTLTLHKPVGNNMEWLRMWSGLSKKYLKKIISVRFSDSTGDLTIEFDRSANCFRAIEQISRQLFICRGMTCPRGHFRSVLIRPHCQYFLRVSAHCERVLRRFGHPLVPIEAERFCNSLTGNLVAYLFVWRQSDMTENVRFFESGYVISSEPIVALLHTRVEGRFIDDLWKKFGPKYDKVGVERLKIVDDTKA